MNITGWRSSGGYKYLPWPHSKLTGMSDDQCVLGIMACFGIDIIHNRVNDQAPEVPSKRIFIGGILIELKSGEFHLGLEASSKWLELGSKIDSCVRWSMLVGGSGLGLDFESPTGHPLVTHWLKNIISGMWACTQHHSSYGSIWLCEPLTYASWERTTIITSQGGAIESMAQKWG